MESKSKIVIVGAGLAGLTAAIHLSKLGYSIIIIEKNSFPKHKVCGEYISNEVIPYLDWLGIHPEILQPTQIEHLHFSTRNGKSVQTLLPLGGFGISRYAFDDYLSQIAIGNNCKILHETVNSIEYMADVFSIELSNNKVIQADMVLGAYGKRSHIDQKLGRTFIQKKSPWLAVKGHFKVDFPNNLVGLHHFEGGYCGVSKVENNTVNICYLADYETFKQHKNIEEYQKNIVAKNPFLGEIFEKAVPIFEKPLTISQISFEKKDPVENHILMIGDSAGLIHPLCGNGMAMAIHSAKIACELIDVYCSKTMAKRSLLEEKYTQEWNRNFRKRIRTGRWLSRLLRQPILSEPILKLSISFPFLLKAIIKSTHGQPIKAPNS